MAIIDLLSEQNREREKAELRNSAKTASSVAVLAAMGAYAYKNTGMASEIKKGFSALKANKPNEFASAGRAIRRDTETLREVLAGTKKQALEDFERTVLSSEKLDQMFAGGETGDMRAFLSSLFDAAKAEQDLATDEIEPLIRRLYDAPADIKDVDKETLKTFYKEKVSRDPENLERFKRSFNTQRSMKHLFTQSLSPFESVANQVQMDTITDHSKLSRGITQKFQKIRGISSGMQVSMIGFREFEGAKGMSYYARIRLNNERFLNVPLQLAQNTQGLSIFRGTEGGATRYAAPQSILDVREIFTGANISTASRQTLNRGTKTYEDHIFGEFISAFTNNRSALQNLSSRQLNDYYGYLRGFGSNAPRSMFASTNLTRTNGQALVNNAFRQSLSFSREIEATTSKVVGLNTYNQETQNLITRRLMQLFPDRFGGTSQGQATIESLNAPFLKGGVQVASIQNLINPFAGRRGGLATSELNTLKTYGRIDRALQPQSAREQQMIGRYESITNPFDDNPVFGPKTIGGKKNTRRISTFGRGSELLGISSRADNRMMGMNVGGVFLFETAQEAATGGLGRIDRLGLGEGMSYFGGKLRVTKDLSKTIVEEGLDQSTLLTELLAARKDPSKQFLIVGGQGADYTLDQFFSKFGDAQGRAILGRQDLDFSVIKRSGGLHQLRVGITDYSEETGRRRYHIGGTVVQDVDRGKLFSPLIKGTTTPITEVGMKEKLRGLGLAEVGQEYFKTFGGQAQSTLLGTTDVIEKSPHFLRTQIAGGFAMLGGDTASLDRALDKELGRDSAYLAEINRMTQKSYASLDQASLIERQGAGLGIHIRETIKQARSQGIGPRKMGFVLSLAGRLAEREQMGLSTKYMQDVMGGDYYTEAMRMAAKGAVIGASFVSSGGVHADLGRNLARVEQRFANYMYSSLRGNFGLTDTEATKYLGSFIHRMGGIEGRMSGYLGMKVAGESLTKLDADAISKQLSGLDIKQLSKDEAEELLRFGQSETRGLVNFLSRSKQGSLLNIDDLGFAPDAKRQIQEMLGGKSQIFLPGEDTLKGFIGHEIRSSGDTIRLEAEYNRYLGDLMSSFGSIRDSGTDTQGINRGIEGFKVAKASLAKVGGAALRNVLAGEVLGSGSYMGQGLSLSNVKTDQLFMGDGVNQAKAIQGYTEVFNKEKGYVAFLDAQAFLDGMSGQRKAIERELARQGKSPTTKEVSHIMNESLKDFFLGMYRTAKTGVSGTIMRNPTVSFSHFMPGISLYRKDFANSVDDFFGLATADIREHKFRQLRPDAWDVFKKQQNKARWAQINTEYERHLGGESAATLYNQQKARLSGTKWTPEEADLRRLRSKLKAAKVTTIGGQEYTYRQLENMTDPTSRKHFARMKQEVEGRQADINRKWSSSQQDALWESSKRKIDDKNAIHREMKRLKGLRDKQQASPDYIKIKDKVSADFASRRKSVIQEAIDQARPEDIKDISYHSGRSRRDFLELQQELQRTQNFDDILGDADSRGLRISSFRQLAKIEERAMGLKDTLGEPSVKDINRFISNIHSGILSNHLRHGAHGGGLVYFPNIDASMDLVDDAGAKIGSYSGRLDFSRFTIGDYDADIYQIFYDTDRSLNAKLASTSSPVSHKGLYSHGAQFLTMMDQLKKGMGNLATRMGVSGLGLNESAIDQYTKELMLKSVGGLDVNIKTGMLGLVHGIGEDASETFANRFQRMQAGAALIQVAQEVLTLKAKTLPTAQDIGKEFNETLKEIFKSGKGDSLKRFFKDRVLKDTPLGDLMERGEGQIKFRNIDFKNIPEGEASRTLRAALQETNMSLKDMFDTFDTMAKAVKEGGFAHLGSDTRMARVLERGDAFSMRQFSELMGAFGSMEGGFTGSEKDIDTLENIFKRAEKTGAELGRISVGGRGVAGLVFGGLVASYGLGATQNIQSLENGARFSDMRARESVGNRGLYHATSREHKNVSPHGLAKGNDNFYERPINSGETLVSLNRSSQLFGEAPTMQAAQAIGRHYSAAGGNTSLLINDARMPISNSYITKSLRD